MSKEKRAAEKRRIQIKAEIKAMEDKLERLGNPNHPAWLVYQTQLQGFKQELQRLN